MRSVFRVVLSAALFLTSPLLTAISTAQTLSPDQSTNTRVTADPSRQTFTIDQGTIQGQSLFHSFETFSPESWSVLFDLSDSTYNNIDLVLGRVTGAQRSLINGELKIIGGQSPDLFLINPTGITFGANTRLQLPGSLVVSTAESIVFGEKVLDTTSTAPLPLLSISRPTGIRLGAESSDILVTGIGHQLTVQHPFFAPTVRMDTEGMRLNTGETLALIGSQLRLEGGLVNAPGGQIELGSVAAGEVGINHQLGTLGFDYSTVKNFRNIELHDQALLDISSAMPGVASGSLRAFGQAIQIREGSAILGQNQGLASGGNITINASEQLTVSGVSNDARLFSSTLLNTTVFEGDSGDVRVSTPKLSVQDGGILGTRTFSAGDAGTVILDANEITVAGYAPQAAPLFSRAGSFSINSGNVGNIVIPDAQTLSIKDGGFLGSVTLQDGAGGNLEIKARDISVTGATPTGEQSLLVSLTIGSTGNAGNLTINTDRLNIENSGLLVTSSYTDGSAGNITINATEYIKVGGLLVGLTPSTISSGVNFAPPVYQQITGVTQQPTGDAGQLSLTSPQIQIGEGGTVNVANFGTGDAGSLNIIASNLLEVSGSGNISALTTSGGQGDISVTTNILRMREGGSLQATSLGTQNGGNINIDATFLVGTENSDIVANAVLGNGGNIDITTQGIFGFQFRDQLTDESDITASSELGVDGSVEVEYAGTQLGTGLISLPAYFSDVDNQVAASCSTSGGNQFVASGRGGLATQPNERVSISRLWNDVRSLTEATTNHTIDTSDNLSSSDTQPDTEQPASLTEATGWRQNIDGQIALLAEEEAPSVYSQQPKACLQQVS